MHGLPTDNESLDTRPVEVLYRNIAVCLCDDSSAQVPRPVRLTCIDATGCGVEIALQRPRTFHQLHCGDPEREARPVRPIKVSSYPVERDDHNAALSSGNRARRRLHASGSLRWRCVSAYCRTASPVSRAVVRPASPSWWYASRIGILCSA